MCGFAGFYPSINMQKDNFFLNSMLNRIKYRGPDDTNIFRNNFIALGHHRLSIIDIAGGKQPSVDTKTKDCLVFNGEIYGYKKLAKRLKDEGIELNNSSDTEVLFKMLINYGIKKTLEKINGMFSFAYYNSREHAIYLARDRAGEKPLYYSFYKNHLLFGSEVKSIVDFPLFEKNIDFNSISDYLYLDYISSDKTLISSVKKVKPGEVIKYSEDKLTSFKYWSLSQSSKKEISEKETLLRLDELLEKSIKNRLVADVPLGLFLSGGIDSSLVAYYSKKLSSNIVSFTIGLQNNSYDESNYANIVSNTLGIKNHLTILSEKDLLSSVYEIEEKIDEPINDPSIIPTFLVSKIAKEKVKVVLSGDGADELFSGYAPFRHMKIMRLLSCFPKPLGSFIYKVLGNVSYKDDYMSPLFLAKQISKGLGYNATQQAFKWMSSYARSDLEKIFINDFSEKYLKHHDAIENLVDSLEEKKSLHDKLTHLFFENYLPHNILVKVDRASMYNGLEVRSPFLDKNIIEFAATMKNSLKIKNKTKYILRKLSNDKIPKEIVHRKKHGFAIPLAKMLRSSLKEKVSETLTSNKARVLEFVNKKSLIKILDLHYKGIDNRKIIWSLYILEVCLNNNLKN